MAGNGGERLFAPQMGAAAVAVVTGAYLWLTLHESSFGVMEQFLTAGALCALLAVAIQAIVIGSTLRALHRRGDDDAKARSRMLVTHRVAAVLLVVATVAMAAARYA
jgi:cytochrome bd-type quinol oxidase subunit 2